MKIIVIALFLVSCFNLLAQSSLPTQIRAQWTMDRLTDKGALSSTDLLYGIPMQPGDVVGSVYADTKWNKATILLTESKNLLEGYLVKYNLNEQSLEIKTASGVKILGMPKILSMVWVDSLTNQPHYFVSPSPYAYEGTKLEGLLEVLVDGPAPLFKYYKILIKQPTYNVAMGSGSKDTKILVNELYFGKKGSDLIRIKSSKDLSLLPEVNSELETYIKTNKLSPKKENELVKIFEFLNTK